MKAILLAAALGLATSSVAQYYPSNNNMPPPNQYPEYNSGGGYYGNQYGGQYGDQYGDYDYYDDNFYDYAYGNFPKDYYYNYPTDYYPSGYYQGFYNDYRRSIVSINWNNFFIEFNLNPVQIQQIMIVNNRFGNYNSWYSYYGANPNRWYYDRFYMLERILGPRIYVIFQDRYYRRMNPIVYFQNYNRTYYSRHYHCVPKYKHVKVSNYYVGRDRFFVDNPKYSGFRNGNGNSNSGSFKSQNSSLRNNIWAISNDNKSGFRENTGFQNNAGNSDRGFRDQSNSSKNPSGGFRNEGFSSQNQNKPVRESGNSGFRGGDRDNSSVPKMERSNSGFRNEGRIEKPQRIEQTNTNFGNGNRDSGFRGSNSGGSFRSESRNQSQGSASESGKRGGFR